jgi:hypothetical protein
MYNKDIIREANIFFGTILGMTVLTGASLIAAIATSTMAPQRIDNDTQGHCDLSGESLLDTQKSLSNTLNKLAKGREYSVCRIYHSTTEISNGKQITAPCVSYEFK